MALLSTFINAQTHDYELIDGKVVYANELATEAYTRIITPLGTYIFDLTFGCELPHWVNARNKVTASMVTQAVNNALLPMIQQNRALGVTTVVNAITLGSVNFTVNITDVENNTFQFTVSYSGN